MILNALRKFAYLQMKIRECWFKNSEFGETLWGPAHLLGKMYDKIMEINDESSKLVERKALQNITTSLD